MKTKNIILVAMFTALTIVGGFIKIPIGPAPITLQFLFTAFAGILLGPRLGALSQLIYVIMGLIGIPVFTQGGGISYIFKPTFGYLIGFIFAAYIIGKLSKNISQNNFMSVFRIFLGCMYGLLIIYLIGVPYMYIILNHVMGVKMSIETAVKAGFIVFLPGDFIKALIASLIGVKVCTSYKLDRS